MSLNDLRERLSKNRKKIGLIFLILLLVVIGTIYYLPSLKKEETPGGVSQEIPAFSFAGDVWSIQDSVNLSQLPSQTLPQTALLYEILESQDSISGDEALAIAARFGFNEEPVNRTTLPEGGTMFVFAKDEENLAISSQPREIRYTFKNLVAKTSGISGTFPDQVAAEEKVKTYLQEKNLSTGALVFYSARYFTYGAGEVIAQTTSPDTANALEISFTQSVAEIPVLGKTLAEPLVRATLNRAGEIISLSYKFPDQTFQAQQELSLLGFSEATAQMKAGGLVVYIFPTSASRDQFSQTENLTTFTPKSVRFVYYPLSSGFLYPVFLFEGEGVMGGLSVSAVVILPALAP